MSTSNSNRKLSGLSFLAGLAIGGATLYFLNTKQGKKLRVNATRKGEELVNEAQIKINQFSEESRKMANEISNQAKSLANDLKNTVSTKIENGKSLISDSLENISKEQVDIESQVIEDFKNGAKRAKELVQKGAKL